MGLFYMECPERPLGGSEIDEASEHVGTDPVTRGTASAQILRQAILS